MIDNKACRYRGSLIRGTKLTPVSTIFCPKWRERVDRFWCRYICGEAKVRNYNGRKNGATKKA